MDGSVKYSGTFRNGYPDKTLTKYYPTTVVIEKVNGEIRYKTLKNMLKSRINYDYDMYRGDQRTIEGITLQPSDYTSAREGPSEEWFVDGTPYKIENYSNDMKEGLCEEFDKTGTLRHRAIYKDDNIWLDITDHDVYIKCKVHGCKDEGKYSEEMQLICERHSNKENRTKMSVGEYIYLQLRNSEKYKSNLLSKSPVIDLDIFEKEVNVELEKEESKSE
jgi:hypothetical protein